MIERDKAVDNQGDSQKNIPNLTREIEDVHPAKNTINAASRAELGIKFHGEWMDLVGSLESDIETKGAC